MVQGKEKRRDPRVRLVLRVDWPDAPAARGATENLSAGGLFVRTERELAVGARAVLEISFPRLLDPVQVEVEVVRRDEASASGPAGVAVRLPADRPDERERLARLADAARAARRADGGYRVLVVEDNPHVLDMYEYALRKVRPPGEGPDVAVEYASNGHEALARLAEPPAVDLVVADLFMPVLDGFTLVERIRADEALASTPVLVVSAGGAEARARALDLGADVYLQKPVQLADVIHTVRTLLELSR